MADFIKRILKSKPDQRYTDWASREEREQFKRQREQWRDNLTMLGILR